MSLKNNYKFPLDFLENDKESNLKSIHDIPQKIKKYSLKVEETILKKQSKANLVMLVIYCSKRNNNNSLLLEVNPHKQDVTLAETILISVINYEMNLLKQQKIKSTNEFNNLEFSKSNLFNPKVSAGEEYQTNDWMNTISRKKTLKDIREYAGNGLITLVFMVENSEINHLTKITDKYKKNVEIIPIEHFAMVDNKGRLQLHSKTKFLTKPLGNGSFFKTLFHTKIIKEYYKSGIRYLYFQPLNNLLSKIMDFDMMDILISSSEISKDSSFITSNIEDQSILDNFNINSENHFNTKKKSLSQKIKQMSNSVLIKTPFNKSKKEKSLNKSNNSKYYPVSSIIQAKKNERINLSGIDDEDNETIFDCISKVYDLEGDLALKVHDDPTDNLNGIKFMDYNKGINIIKLHPGESFFDIKSLLSSSFLKKYNYCKIVMNSERNETHKKKFQCV